MSPAAACGIAIAGVAAQGHEVAPDCGRGSAPVILLLLDDPRAVRIFDVIPSERRCASVHCVMGTRRYSATDAFGVICRHLRGGGVLLHTSLYRICPFVAGNHHVLGRLVPEPADQAWHGTWLTPMRAQSAVLPLGA